MDPSGIHLIDFCLPRKALFYFFFYFYIDYFFPGKREKSSLLIWTYVILSFRFPVIKSDRFLFPGHISYNVIVIITLRKYNLKGDFVLCN